MSKPQTASLAPPARIPSADLQKRVSALIASVGVVRASAALGVTRQTLLALAAGVVVRPGSIALACARFAELAAAPRVTA